MVFLADSGGRKSRALLVDRFFDLEARYAASGGELPEKRFHEYTSSADRYGTIYRASPSCGEEEKEKKQIDIHMCENLKETVDLAKKLAKPGQVVLFSPASASFDLFKNFADRGQQFKKLVNEL